MSCFFQCINKKLFSYLNWNKYQRSKKLLKCTFLKDFCVLFFITLIHFYNHQRTLFFLNKGEQHQKLFLKQTANNYFKTFTLSPFTNLSNTQIDLNQILVIWNLIFLRNICKWMISLIILINLKMRLICFIIVTK